MKRRFIPDKANEARVLFIGPAGCGKTSFLGVYTDKSFMSGYCPTVIDNFCYNFKNKGKEYQVVVWDTAGTSPRLLQASLDMSKIDLVCFCYAIDSRTDFGASLDIWRKFKDNFCSKTPTYLIAMKADLRIASSADFISKEEGEQLAKQMNAVGFMETSALTYTNIVECLSDFSLWISKNCFIYTDEEEEEEEKKQKKPFFKRLFGR